MTTVEEPRRRFPADIEAEILLRLPVKTIIRFKIASFSTKPKLSLVNKFSKTLQQPMFDNSMCGKPFMQSCMGLVCIASWSWTIPPILVCNPSTRDLILLPPTKEYNVRVGFGYIPSTHQFKVVRFFSEGNKMKSRCQVFTLGTTHWREAPSTPYRVCDGLAPFLHGAVHCLPETSPRGVQSTDVIVAFNIDTEEYGKIIPLPAFYHSLGKDLNTTRKRLGIVDIKNFMRLTILGGSLCLTFDFGEHKCCLELWILKDYNNAQWVKGYTIDVSSVYPYPGYSFWAYPTDNMVDEGILLNCSSEQGVKLLGYNPESGTVKVKKVKEWAATFYEETLYSLRS